MLSITNHRELYEATGHDIFVQVDTAARAHVEGLSLAGSTVYLSLEVPTQVDITALGNEADIATLLTEMMTQRRLAGREVGNINLPQHCRALQQTRFPQAKVVEWEWMDTTTAPDPHPAQARIQPLTDAHLPMIKDFLAKENPRTDARPGERNEKWVGVANPSDGGLVAIGSRSRQASGHWYLSGITVANSARRQGLGKAITTILTRDSIDDTGRCSLGMYSDNAPARTMYLSLGYQTTHAYLSFNAQPDAATVTA